MLLVISFFDIVHIESYFWLAITGLFFFNYFFYTYSLCFRFYFSYLFDKVAQRTL